MNFKYLIAICVNSFCLTAYAQIDTLKFIDGTKMILDGEKIIYPSMNNGGFRFVETRAEFPQGMNALNAWITDNISHDARWKEDVTVNVAFTITQKGLPGSISMQGDTTNGRGKEASRLIQKMPRWKPASQQGKTVKMRLVLPIKFSKSE